MHTAAGGVKLEGSLTYVKCELADARVESKPVFRLYLDAHFVRSEANGGVITVTPNEERLGIAYPIEVRGEVPKGQGLPETACLGVASYALRRNAQGMSCYTNAGTTHVRLAEVAAALNKTVGGVYERELPLLMETTRLTGDPVEKGRIKVRITAMHMSPRITMTPLRYCILGKSAECATQIAAFLKERTAFEQSFPDTWSNMSNVRVPMDISSAGVELVGSIFVPIEGFLMNQEVTVNEGFYKNAFEHTMRRHGFSDARREFASLPRARKAEIMVDMMSYASQSLDYISDTVDRSSRTAGPYEVNLKQAFEDMSNAGTTGSGDCEDLACLILAIFLAFLKLIDKLLHQGTTAVKVDPILVELHGIARCYIGFLTLATVHGAKADDKTEHIGAHMYVLFLPKYQVRQALERTPGGKLWSDNPALDGWEECKGYPTLFAEGTGMIHSMGPGELPREWQEHGSGRRLPHLVRNHFIQAAQTGAIANHPLSYDPLMEERRYLGMRLRSKEGRKMFIPHALGAKSSFYLGTLTLVTPAFMDLGYPLGTFICCKQGASGQLSRGALFTDVINQRSDFIMVPQKPMPEPIMQMTREATSLRAPPRPFLYSGKPPPPGEDTKLLDQLQSSVAALGRTGRAPYGSVDLYVRPHQLNESSARFLLSEIKHLGRVYKLEHEVEPITDIWHTNRVRFFIDQQQQQNRQTTK